MKKTHLLLLSAALISFVSLTGCDNKEKIRHELCSKAVLDFNQHLIGDKSIDIDAADKIIKEYSCTYGDVTKEEESERKEYLRAHPIKAEPLRQNGKDWSNLYPNQAPVDWTGKSKK